MEKYWAHKAPNLRMGISRLPKEINNIIPQPPKKAKWSHLGGRA